MNNNIFIRTVTGDDLGRIVELERQIFADPWSANDIGDFHRETSIGPTELMHSSFFAAVNDEDIAVGYICVRRILDEGEILNVAVSPDMRRCGIGRMLMEAAMIDLKKHGARSVFLEVRKSNTAAQRLYEAFGFRPEAIRKNYYRLPTEDAILMKCTADSAIE